LTTASFTPNAILADSFGMEAPFCPLRDSQDILAASRIIKDVLRALWGGRAIEKLIPCRGGCRIVRHMPGEQSWLVDQGLQIFRLTKVMRLVHLSQVVRGAETPPTLGQSPCE
jgi:hypothetical protein